MDIFVYRVELVFGGHSRADVERAQAWRLDMPGRVLHSAMLCFFAFFNSQLFFLDLFYFSDDKEFYQHLCSFLVSRQCDSPFIIIVVVVVVVII